MDNNVVAGLGGVLIGVMSTVCVYPFILKRKAEKLFARCSATTNELGDPLSQFLSLLVYQLTAAYNRLEGKDMEQAKVELSEIIASYASYVKSKGHRYQGEQGALDAIDEACAKSETLRRIVGGRGNPIEAKTVGQVIEQLENELANHGVVRTR